MLDISKIRLIAVDADDTLWETQPFFDEIEEKYCHFLEHYAPYEVIDSEFFKRECANMHKLGYGSKAFIISLVENAIDVSEGRVKSSELKQIIEWGKSLVDIPATPLDGVEETLEKVNALLNDSSLFPSRPRMIIFTKGDSKEQELKIFRSGLLRYFDDYRVYTDKKEEDYRRLLNEFGVVPTDFLMIGNSFKSDIDPVLKIGANAVYIPFYAPWRFESTTEYEHGNLYRAESFKKLLSFLSFI